MSTTSHSDAAQIDDLRSRLALRESDPTLPHLPVEAGLSAVLPSGLRCGTTYQVEGSVWLLATLLSRASQRRHWCAVVGMPDFGIESAADAGVDLDRLVLVPAAGEQWLRVVSHLLEVMAIVAVHPAEKVSPTAAMRLAARQRRYRSVLLSYGSWPRAETRVRLVRRQWHGLDAGHGRLRSRTVDIEAFDKSGRSAATLDVSGGLLSGSSLSASPVQHGDGAPRLVAVPGGP